MGCDGVLSGKLLIQDFIGQTVRTISFQRDPAQVRVAMQRDMASEHEEQRACATPEHDGITAEELQHALDSNERWQFLDVRELHEQPQVDRLQGHRIPLHELTIRIGELDPDRPTVVYCQSGVRSRLAVKLLREHGMADVHSLEGGVLAWMSEVKELNT